MSALFDTSMITDDFPYPQILAFSKVTIVCGATKICEVVDGSLTLQLTVMASDLWSAVDFYDYIYMSNGAVAVVRDSNTGEYSSTVDLPSANGMLNYNGQVLIAPN